MIRRYLAVMYAATWMVTAIVLLLLGVRGSATWVQVAGASAAVVGQGVMG